MIRSIALLATLLTSPATAQTRDADVARIRTSAGFQAAERRLAERHEQFVENIVTITEVPAPPFKEAARAKLLADRFRAAGLTGVTIDAVGNVTGLRAGSDPKAKLIVVSAHLDTVFPEGTPIKVVRDGTRLSAPGIGDDSRGLAALLAYADALTAGRVVTRAPVLFVATVGEEGRGDLRGVRHLFTKGPYATRIGGFFSIDGSDASRVTIGGVGSKRYHVVFKGPGGHSYGAFGIVNPATAMASAVADLYRITPPAKPRTTYSASVFGGGTSVNAIPSEVFVDVDMRSEDAAALATLERQWLAIVARSAEAENAARSTRAGRVSVTPELVGDRPAGATPPTAPLVRSTTAAVQALGYTPNFDASSTDSNMAMSLGIPAVTIGSGGTGGRAHAPDEWIDVAKPESVRGLTAGLLALVSAAGLAR
jgi:tripeptide aminopeptidase